MEFYQTYNRSYDYRIKELIVFSNNPKLFPELNIPKSTAKTWIRKGIPDVVTCDLVNDDEKNLQLKVIELENRYKQIETKFNLLEKVTNILDLDISWSRFPAESKKKYLLSSVNEALETISLMEALSIIGLSESRYYSWKRKEKGCELKDYDSCPKSNPTQLTSKEVSIMKEMTLSKDYSHLSVRALSFLSKRLGKLFCSAESWGKYIRAHNWKRPRLRLYPKKPKVGIRASAPNRIWHVDVTMIRLIDGTRCFIQAVIDNYSRFVLAWNVSAKISGMGTRDLLNTALKKAAELGGISIPEVYVDGGVENINALVDELISENKITRTIAQVEIEFSNSMIEALFRSMKHNHLFQVSIKSFEILVKQVNFYLNDHNTLIPHNAFQGATPEEVYLNRWNEAEENDLKRRIAEARIKRMEYHRSLKCKICE